MTIDLCAGQETPETTEVYLPEVSLASLALTFTEYSAKLNLGSKFDSELGLLLNETKASTRTIEGRMPGGMTIVDYIEMLY
ncbi:hypothetical protein [Mucilaginibacter aquatilis]|uniref:Uncharacterized protein n=1 Tax=Mucilaginibacter aquatilis TaxID=1517760 RepID=A0A6I4IRA4_9SPHI|nr:hypothetical protein [Mucilaginibacter aquatilis]MVN93153.1 hypothetical protein [Mucilaginibacter aquatilis]